MGEYDSDAPILPLKTIEAILCRVTDIYELNTLCLVNTFARDIALRANTITHENPLPVNVLKRWPQAANVSVYIARSDVPPDCLPIRAYGRLQVLLPDPCEKGSAPAPFPVPREERARWGCCRPSPSGDARATFDPQGLACEAVPSTPRDSTGCARNTGGIRPVWKWPNRIKEALAISIVESRGGMHLTVRTKQAAWVNDAMEITPDGKCVLPIIGPGCNELVADADVDFWATWVPAIRAVCTNPSARR